MLVAGAPSLLPTLALLSAPPQPAVLAASNLLAVEVPGAQPVDIFYIAGVVVVLGFGAKIVFDSAFPENTDEYVPPMPGSLPGPLKNLPCIGDGGKDPAQEAEALRQKLLAAAEAGDLETAYRTEQERKSLMAESGMRLVVDDEFQRSEDAEPLPDKW